MSEDARDVEREGGPPKVVIGLIVAVIVVIVVVLVFSRSKDYVEIVEGVEAPAFNLPDLKGKPQSLKDFKGKVVFLNIWATWCTTCEEEMPSMQVLSTALKGRPFEIVAVSIDTEPVEAVRKFADKYGLTFTILHDKSANIKEVYKTTGVPETFIIDQNGIIAEKVIGPRDWTQKENLKTVFDLLQNGPKNKDAYGKYGAQRK